MPEGKLSIDIKLIFENKSEVDTAHPTYIANKVLENVKEIQPTPPTTPSDPRERVVLDPPPIQSSSSFCKHAANAVTAHQLYDDYDGNILGIVNGLGGRVGVNVYPYYGYHQGRYLTKYMSTSVYKAFKTNSYGWETANHHYEEVHDEAS